MKFKLILPFLLFFALISSSFAQEGQKKVKKNKDLEIGAEAGATLSKGNTREESIYSKNKIDYRKNNWTEIFKTRLENTKVNERRVKERYDVNNQVRYNFSKKNYRLLELEYIDDRFAGYDYRASETFGFGRNILQREDMKLSTQLSVGMRQIKFTNSDKEFTSVARFGLQYDWTIKDGIVFHEDLDISIDQEATITKSDTSLRIDLNKVHHAVYLKIGYFIEHRTNVPTPGVKNSDSIFMTTIGYNY